MGRIARAGRKSGLEVEEGKGTSHWKFKCDGRRTYPIPASNSEKTEIDDIYIKGLCRNFGLDLEEFKKLL